MTINSVTHPLSEISFDPTQSLKVAIEASAGTGKTWTIERLVVKALLEHSQLNISNILVVTFTKDATRELKTRILAQLKATIGLLIARNNIGLEPSDDPFVRDFITTRPLVGLMTDITVLTRAVQLFEQAPIYTIHSFCQKVLTDFPLLTQVSLPIKTVASHQQILEMLVSRFYREHILYNPALAADLWQVITNLKSLFNQANGTTLVEQIRAKLPSDLLQLKDGSFRVKYHIPAAADLSLLREEKVDKAEALAALYAALLSFIANEYASYRNLKLQLSFDELIELVAEGVDQVPAFADQLYQRYPVAFIDEFQDTDSQQWTIFSGIYHLQRQPSRGHVVVVGDPKQAIYRFRGADIATYITAVQTIGVKKNLLENRRSHPHIMNFINQLFDPANQPQLSEFLGQGIAYHPIQAKVDSHQLLSLPTALQLQQLCAERGVNARFYDAQVHLVALPRATLTDARRDQDWLLNALAFEVLALVNANPELIGKIAILVTTNAQASNLVKILGRYGVKACELKLGNIFASATAQELWRILAALDNLSVVSKVNQALATSLINFDLSKLANREQHPREFEVVYQQFNTYQYLWREHGILALIYQVVADTVSHGNHLSERELANLYQLGELLHKQSQLVHNNYELMHWFKTKLDHAHEPIAEELDGEAEELIRLDNDSQQVIITTQHKAKGLEFDILFCPYCKSDEKVNGRREGYKLPFFANYSQTNQPQFSLINDLKLAQQIVERDNSEIHRLNYVALTRAKSRLYLYFKPTPLSSKSAATYDGRYAKPKKLDELFGYNQHNAEDCNHRLFNYQALFDEVALALTPVAQALLPGVVAYQLYVSTDDLAYLRYTPAPPVTTAQTAGFLSEVSTKSELFANLEDGAQPVVASKFCRSYMRQSYSGLVRSATTAPDSWWHSIINEIESEPEANLDLKQQHSSWDLFNGKLTNQFGQPFSGARLGLLFHELCEHYPLSAPQLQQIAGKYQLDAELTADFPTQLAVAFKQPLVAVPLNLHQIVMRGHYQSEFEFNLAIKAEIDLVTVLGKILCQVYGPTHPFSQACRSLSRIEPGFLTGFIDLIFFADNKFWVVDYKTNYVDDYTSTTDPLQQDNALLISIAEHHYYLQYLLYLLALKRHLECCYQVSDASSLLGGAIYFYVRGAYLPSSIPEPSGIFSDNLVLTVVQQLDQVLKGKPNNA